MFYSTQEAIKYGLKIEHFEKVRLARLRRIFGLNFEAAMYRGQFDLASMFATQSQFCREAIEAETIVNNNPDLLK